MPKQMTLGNKLFLCVGTLGTFLLLLTGIGWYGVSELDRRLNDALSTQSKKLQLMGSLATTGEGWLADQRGFLMRTISKEDDLANQARRDVAEDVRQMEHEITELLPLLQVEATRQALAKMQTMQRELVREQPQLLELLAAHKLNEGLAFQTSKLRPLFDALNAESKSLFRSQNQLMNDLQQQAESRASLCRALIIGAGVLAVVVCAIVVWIIRGANRHLRTVAGEIAAGAQQVSS